MINKNVEKFNLKNVEVIKAYAPIDIEGEVDAIFLEEQGNRLNEILLWSKEKLVPGGRLVANFIIVETFNETLRLLREYGFENIDVFLFRLPSHLSLVWSCFLSNFCPRISSDFGLIIWHEAAMFDIFSNRRQNHSLTLLSMIIGSKSYSNDNYN